MNKIAMISGHLDLTQEEFNEHYAPRIRDALAQFHDFVVGDAPGCDAMAQQLLSHYWLPYNVEVTVYYQGQFPAPRHNYGMGGYPTIGVNGSVTEKDKAMTQASDYDICWVRPDKHSSASGRVSGTEQNLVRRKAKDMGK